MSKKGSYIDELKGGNKLFAEFEEQRLKAQKTSFFMQKDEKELCIEIKLRNFENEEKHYWNQVISYGKANESLSNAHSVAEEIVPKNEKDKLKFRDLFLNESFLKTIEADYAVQFLHIMGLNSNATNV